MKNNGRGKQLSGDENEVQTIFPKIHCAKHIFFRQEREKKKEKKRAQCLHHSQIFIGAHIIWVFIDMPFLFC
jgi:hypothetical protein